MTTTIALILCNNSWLKSCYGSDAAAGAGQSCRTVAGGYACCVVVLTEQLSSIWLYDSSRCCGHCSRICCSGKDVPGLAALVLQQVSTEDMTGSS
jgi:hypothetical protein